MRRAAILAVSVAAVLMTGCVSDDGTRPEDVNGSEADDPAASDGNRSDEVGGSASGPSDPPGNGSTPDAETESAPEAPEPLRFSDPVQVNGNRPAFEPSVAVGPSGSVYVTAARFREQSLPEDRVVGVNDPVGSSPVWYSNDDGSTWSRMPSPAEGHRALPGLEGDLAVDDEGDVYFVDLTGPDNTFTRWSSSEGEPVWEMTRPVQGTAAYLDDRPWLAAHGEGVVYYLGNTGVSAPGAPGVAPVQPGERIWFHVSEDGGRTWSPGHSFDGSTWCTMAPSEVEAGTVHVGCGVRPAEATDLPEVPPEEAVLFTSTDGGDTFSSSTLLDLDHSSYEGEGFPGTAVDEAGNAFLVMADDDFEDEIPGTLEVGVELANGTTRSLNVTPFRGTVGNVWAGSGPEGMLAVTFHATEDVPPTENSTWFPYALLTSEADEHDPAFQVARLDATPGSTGSLPPSDFFQSTVGPDGRLHVVVHREGDEGFNPAGPILYTRQVAGSNLSSGS